MASHFVLFAGFDGTPGKNTADKKKLAPILFQPLMSN
jgi:hypothetical protein